VAWGVSASYELLDHVQCLIYTPAATMQDLLHDVHILAETLEGLRPTEGGRQREIR